MLLEFEKRLSEIAPIFLRKEEMNGYFFPVECDDGWFIILKKYLSRIEEINNSNGKVKVIADQIKEKYGELNIYFHVSGDSEKERTEAFDKVEKITEEAEEESWKTCEHCGKPATQTTTGWITRLCDECYEKRMKRII